MVRGLSLVVLAALLAGCTSYRSRGQGPFADKPKRTLPPPPQLASERGTKNPTSIPTNPLPPPPPGASATEASPVPPRPPEQPAAAAPGEPKRTGRILIEGDTPSGDRVILKTPDAATPPQPTAAAPKAEPSQQFSNPVGFREGIAPQTPAAVAPPQAPRPPAVPEAPSEVRPAQALAPAAPSGAAAVAKLADAAVKKWAATDTFEAKLTRREVVGRNPAQTEEVVVQVRREPFAVYMRNVGEAGRGREVLYNPAKHDDLVHAVVGEGDSRLYAAGRKAPSLSPDSPLVKNKSRRSIRDAGPGTPVAVFARLAKSSPGELRYVGPARRPEFGDHPLELVEQAVAKGAEPGLDRAGVRSWYFDAKPDSPSFGLPVLVTLVEAGTPARELEYYCYTQVKAPAGLTDADFALDRLGRPRR